MNKIEVAVLNTTVNPDGIMMFLAKMTQRGHTVSCMQDVLNAWDTDMNKKEWKMAKQVAKMPHGTIKRFAPITIAIVGASRRFLPQIRTHHIGLEFVSGSLQYSDYSDGAEFVVPYELLLPKNVALKESFLTKCRADKLYYEGMIKSGLQGDTAGYSMNHSLRNILFIHGSIEAFDSMINKRICRRNTDETRYVAWLIKKALMDEPSYKHYFETSGPDCAMKCGCREGHMCCGKPMKSLNLEDQLDDMFPNKEVLI